MSDRNAPRLFVEADLPGTVRLDQRAVNYLRNVLRLSPGAAVMVFNGRDGEFRAVIETFAKRDGVAEARERLRAQTPPPTLTLAFAPLRQARLDILVEKAAEMGAGHLRPILTQHGQVRRINEERLRLRMIEACEQCGILSVPSLAPPVDLATFLGEPREGTLIVADETLAGAPQDAIATLCAAGAPLTVLIGPEGGFSEAERALFDGRAARISLGPRVLRAETAAVALLALAEATHPSVA